MDTDAILDRRRLKRRLTFWRLAAAVVAVALVVLAVRVYLLPAYRPYVARVAIDDVIVEDRERRQALLDLADNKAVKAVIVAINSPGGSTTGSEEVFRALRRIAGSKPVVAVIGTMGASGGYIVALAADHIVARETSLTGSIGVLFRTTEFSGLLDKLGINAESLKSSPLKGEPSPFQPMSKEARAALRAVLDDSYQWFRDLVRRRRGLEGERLAAVADGRVFTGRQALDNGLIDALGGEEAARHWLASSRGVPESLPTVDVHWGEGPPLVNQLVGSLSEKLFSAERLRLDGLLSLWHPE